MRTRRSLSPAAARRSRDRRARPRGRPGRAGHPLPLQPHQLVARSSGTTVAFTVQSSWRRNDTPSFNPCVNPATNTVIPCTGGDGLPLPGRRHPRGHRRHALSTSATAARTGRLAGAAVGSSIWSHRSIRRTTGSSAWRSIRRACPTIDTTHRAHLRGRRGPTRRASTSCCRISANAAAERAHQQPRPRLQGADGRRRWHGQQLVRHVGPAADRDLPAERAVHVPRPGHRSGR